jgi:hypothetical protein
VRNLTIIGLESGMSSGYNLIEEVDLNARGINSVFFESPPISPDFIKKY